MAAQSRSPPLLLLVSTLCLWSSVTVLGLKVANSPAEPPKQSDVRAVDHPDRNAPVAAAAGASQPRRASGWKLAEEAACREDLTRLCPKQTWSNNLAVLECLQDRREVSGWWTSLQGFTPGGDDKHDGHLLGVSPPVGG